jgi:WG containing repeat
VSETKIVDKLCRVCLFDPCSYLFQSQRCEQATKSFSYAPTAIQNMYPIKYSYIDKTGRVIIDASKYQRVASFSDGLSAVFLANKGWGFIDKTGKVAIEPQFQGAGSFSEGMAGVEIEGKWGFIDKTGQIVIGLRYDLVNSFSEGVAVVAKGDEVFLIDKTGQTILSRNMNELELNIYEGTKVSDGLIEARDCAKSKYGFIDKTGRFIIEPKYDQAASFSNALARVVVQEGGEEKVGLIDRSGYFVIPPKFNTDVNFRRNSSDFSEGLVSLTEGLRPTITKEAKSVYIDRKGVIVLSTDFSYAGPFHDGMAVVYDEERSKFGFIDKSGNVVISLQYDLAGDFSEGLAYVAISG